MTDTRESLDELKAKMREGSIPKTFINSGPDTFEMGCGDCGTTQFKIYVKPINTTAQINSVSCCNCGKILYVTGESMVDGQGKIRL